MRFKNLFAWPNAWPSACLAVLFASLAPAGLSLAATRYSIVPLNPPGAWVNASGHMLHVDQSKVKVGPQEWKIESTIVIRNSAGMVVATEASPKLSSDEVFDFAKNNSVAGRRLRFAIVAPGSNFETFAAKSSGAFALIDGRYVDIDSRLKAAESDLSLGPVLNSVAYGVNERRAAVGYFEFRDQNSALWAHAFMYANGRVVDIGTHFPGISIAKKISNQGHVAGFWMTAWSSPERSAFIYRNGATTDIGYLDSRHRWSEIADINDQGVAVGASLTGAEAKHAFVFGQGRMRDLGTLGGNESEAFGINNAGTIVGTAEAPNEVRRAFLHTNGRMLDLNELVDWESGSTPAVLTDALAVNDDGSILAGEQTPSGPRPLYLLKPQKRANN